MLTLQHQEKLRFVTGAPHPVGHGGVEHNIPFDSFVSQWKTRRLPMNGAPHGNTPRTKNGTKDMQGTSKKQTYTNVLPRWCLKSGCATDEVSTCISASNMDKVDSLATGTAARKVLNLFPRKKCTSA